MGSGALTCRMFTVKRTDVYNATLTISDGNSVQILHMFGDEPSGSIKCWEPMSRLHLPLPSRYFIVHAECIYKVIISEWKGELKMNILWPV
jgi:hypothetical protein